MLLRRDLTTGVLGLCAVVLAVPIAAYAITGWFTRYASDDYCTASIVLQQGFLGAQQYWYSTWSGRFSFFALVSAIELGGRGVVQVLPALMLVAAVAVGAWAIGPIARRAHWRHPWLASLVLS